MTWLYLNEPLSHIPSSMYGFVYLITNLENKRKYIGQKSFYFTKSKYLTVTLKNGTKKRKTVREVVESDWREYWSSCEELKQDVASLGPQCYRREILHFAPNRAILNYLEAREQFLRDVLLTDEYYNGHIRIRVHKNHLKKM